VNQRFCKSASLHLFFSQDAKTVCSDGDGILVSFCVIAALLHIFNETLLQRTCNNYQFLSFFYFILFIFLFYSNKIKNGYVSYIVCTQVAAIILKNISSICLKASAENFPGGATEKDRKLAKNSENCTIYPLPGGGGHGPPASRCQRPCICRQIVI